MKNEKALTNKIIGEQLRRYRLEKNLETHKHVTSQATKNKTKKKTMIKHTSPNVWDFI